MPEAEAQTQRRLATLALAGNRFRQAGASMYSVMHVCGNAGGAIVPPAVGLIAKAYNLNVAFACLVLVPLLAVAVISFVTSPDAPPAPWENDRE